MIEQKLNLEQTQKIIITQELRQAITLLTMPVLELQHFIEEQLQENPVLEQEEDIHTDSNGESDHYEEKDTTVDTVQDMLTSGATEDESTYEWEKIAEQWQDDSTYRLGSSAVNREEIVYRYEPVAMDCTNLYEYLQLQLNVLQIPERQRRIAEYIIANLGRDGYLLALPENLAEALRVPLGEFYEALYLVCSLDPPGIGCINLKQCLFLQLDPYAPDYGVLTDIIYNYLDMVAANRLPQLAKKLKMPVEDVQQLVDKIRGLNPRPGLAIESDCVTEYIYPDVMIERVEGSFMVVVNDYAVPKIGINNYYMRLIRNDATMSDDVKNFIKQKLDSAAWIIKGIEQRRSTIYRIAEAIIDLQRDFFEHGPNHLVPLNLSTVAQEVGVHESTVSRAISNKYVQTPYGLYPWKYFFVNGVGGEGDARSAVTNVKSVLKELVEGEDPTQPLNDQALVELLKERGINVFRRTVAKYRKDLGILNASKRRRY